MDTAQLNSEVLDLIRALQIAPDDAAVRIANQHSLRFVRCHSQDIEVWKALDGSIVWMHTGDDVDTTGEFFE